MTSHSKAFFLIALLTAGCSSGDKAERGKGAPPPVRARLARVERTMMASSVEMIISFFHSTWKASVVCTLARSSRGSS